MKRKQSLKLNCRNLRQEVCSDWKELEIRNLRRGVGPRNLRRGVEINGLGTIGNSGTKTFLSFKSTKKVLKNYKGGFSLFSNLQVNKSVFASTLY